MLIELIRLAGEILKKRFPTGKSRFTGKNQSPCGDSQKILRLPLIRAGDPAAQFGQRVGPALA
jgi:hypothetical protein